MDRIWKVLPLFLALTACGGGSSSSTSAKPAPIPVDFGAVLSVAYGHGVFVAVGRDDFSGNEFPWAVTSTDGVNWKSQAQPFLAVGDLEVLNSVAYGTGGFVATPDGPGEDTWQSSDGVTWAIASQAASLGLANVIWDGDEYIATSNGAGGGLATSTDGVNWTQVNTDFVLRSSPCKVAGVWYAVIDIMTGGQSTDGIGSSTDLAHWNIVYQAAAGVSLGHILRIGSNFVVLGGDSAVLTSPDGVTWTSQPAGTYPDLNQVAYNGSIYVGVDTQDAEVFYSTDGLAWIKSFDLPSHPPADSDDIGQGAVAAAPGGMFVIVGGGEADPYSFAGSDGIHWKKGSPKTF